MPISEASRGWRAAPALLDSPLPSALAPATEASPGAGSPATLLPRPGRPLLAKGRLGVPVSASPLALRPSRGAKAPLIERRQEDAPATDPAMDSILKGLQTVQLNSPALQRRRPVTPTSATSSAASSPAGASTSSTPASAEVSASAPSPTGPSALVSISPSSASTVVSPSSGSTLAASPAIACPLPPGASPALSSCSSTSDMLLCDSLTSLQDRDLSTLQSRDLLLSSSSLGVCPLEDLLEGSEVEGGLEAEAWLEQRRASTAGGRRGGLVAQLGYFSRNSPVEPSPLARPPAPLPLLQHIPSPTLSPHSSSLDAEPEVEAYSVTKPKLLAQVVATPPTKPASPLAGPASPLARPASVGRAHRGVPFTGKLTPHQGDPSGSVPSTAPSRIAVARVPKALHTKDRGSSPLGVGKMREAAPSPTSTTSSPTTPRRHRLLPQKVSGLLDTPVDPTSKATLESPLKSVSFTSAHRASPPARPRTKDRYLDTRDFLAKARVPSRLPVAASRTSGAT